jgi:hypothetical protein
MASSVVLGGAIDKQDVKTEEIQLSIADRIYNFISPKQRFQDALLCIALPVLGVALLVTDIVNLIFSSFEAFFGFIFAIVTFGQIEKINDFFAKGCCDGYDSIINITRDIYMTFVMEIKLIAATILYPGII